MSDRDDQPASRALRVILLGGIVMFALAVLVLRLWQVQVRQGSTHTREILRQSIRPIRQNAIRGRMLDANGEVIVGNHSLFDAGYRLAEMRQPGRRARTIEYVMTTTRRLAGRIGRKMPLTEEQLKRHLHVRPALPMTVFRNLEARELAILSELVPPVPGMEIMTRVERHYRFPGSASHILGYTGRQRPDRTLEMQRYARVYVSPELHGWAGLERRYDDELAGIAGSRLVRVSALGYVHEEIGTPVAPQNGNDLQLTLDIRAQRAAELALASDPKGRAGALVAVDVNTGAVVAMASRPTFDLTKVDSSHFDSSYYDALKNDREHRPLLNRAMQSYMPGSILKPLIGLAALETGEVDPAGTYVCRGYFQMAPGARVRCWNRYGHGEVDFVEAVKKSCNPYFIHIGVKTGLDRIRPLLVAAGLGRRPDLDVPPQYAPAEKGICPSREYLREQTDGKRRWAYSDTVFLSIGQGVVGVTPMQAALYTAAIANGGRIYRPFLVRSVQRPDGTEVRATVPQVVSRLPVSPEHLGLVRQGMYEAVNGDGGTAKRARNEVMLLAGKTGTAEVGSRSDSHTETWFIGYGPVQNPAYAVCVLIERGDSGGRTSAPLAAAFFNEWLGQGDGAADDTSAAVMP